MNKCGIRAFDAYTSSLAWCFFDVNGKPVVWLTFGFVAGVMRGPI